MKKIILTILFLFCFFDASFPGSEHLLCPVPEPPATCDKVYHSSSCNAVLCPDNTPFGMAAVVEPVCNSSQYVSTRAPTSGTVTCTLECDVSCIYKCPQGMYGYIAVKDVGDAIYPQNSFCYPCPSGEGVASCGIIEDTNLSGTSDELGNLIQYASKLVCKTGYHESGQDCVLNCPANASCPNGVFEKCNQGYYGDSNGCLVCPTGDGVVCSDGKTFSCADGYIKSDIGCTKCKEGEVCSDGIFQKCANNYYGDANGCIACPNNAICDGGATFSCPDDYKKSNVGCESCGDTMNCTDGQCQSCAANYYGNCEDGCFKCPSLDGRPGKSDGQKALDGTYSNTSIDSCYVTVKDMDNVGNVSDLEGRLTDNIGTYYFEEEKCYATDINK